VSSIFPRAITRTDARRSRAASAVPWGTIESLGENLASEERIGWNPHDGADRVGRIDGGENGIAIVLDKARGQARRGRGQGWRAAAGRPVAWSATLPGGMIDRGIGPVVIDRRFGAGVCRMPGEPITAARLRRRLEGNRAREGEQHTQAPARDACCTVVVRRRRHDDRDDEALGTRSTRIKPLVRSPDDRSRSNPTFDHSMAHVSEARSDVCGTRKPRFPSGIVPRASLSQAADAPEDSPHHRGL